MCDWCSTRVDPERCTTHRGRYFHFECLKLFFRAREERKINEQFARLRLASPECYRHEDEAMDEVQVVQTLT